MQKSKISSIIVIITILFNCCTNKPQRQEGGLISNNAFTIQTNYPNDCNTDSIQTIIYEKEKIVEVKYKNGLVVQLKSYNFLLAITFLNAYHNYRELAIGIFEYRCSKCHQFYPDIKTEPNYRNMTPSELYRMFWNNKHKNVSLDSLEIKSLSVYLHLEKDTPVKILE